MDKIKSYYQLKELIGDKYKELQIEVFYSLGGMNYFSGKMNERGYYLLLSPVNRGSNGMTESTLMGGTHESGFKIFLEETKRKSQKRLEQIADRIKPLIDKIGNLYEKKEYKEIAELVGMPQQEKKEETNEEVKPIRKFPLLTDKLIKRFREVGSQENDTDPIVIAKFFNPSGRGTWYATEYNEEKGIFFGYVSLFGDYNDEWGNFSLKELEEVKGQMGLGIERDRFCGEKRISQFNIPSLAK